MPAKMRTHTARAASSRPYDRRSPTTSPKASSRARHACPSPPPAPASPINDPEHPPDHPGLPTYAEYKRIEAGYLHSLSPRKRDKALITQAMFDKIWDVLHQPDACTVETPQFRFWVRKMFTLSRPATAVGVGGLGVEQWQWGGGGGGGGGAGPRAPEAGDTDDDDDDDDEAAALALEHAMGIRREPPETDAALPGGAVVLHENRPVAIMEQLYELFCYCHVRAGHGGRDKTCAVIREHYAWVPKELTAQFVKACPTCALKRGGGANGEPGALLHRRAVGGGRERRGVQGGPVDGAEAAGDLVWPTTGGPLDPANPPPCGVHVGPTPPAGATPDEAAPGADFFAPPAVFSVDGRDATPGPRLPLRLPGPGPDPPCHLAATGPFEDAEPQIDPALLSADHALDVQGPGYRQPRRPARAGSTTTTRVRRTGSDFFSERSRRCRLQRKAAVSARADAVDADAGALEMQYCGYPDSSAKDPGTLGMPLQLPCAADSAEVGTVGLSQFAILADA